MADRIVLRRWKNDPCNPIALMIDESEGPGMVNSYQHIGQHGAASIGIVADTEPVSADDPYGIALVQELASIGYEPRIMRRVTRK